MKKILHMTPPEVSNGVYRYIFNHMPFIDQSKYQFCFLTKNSEELRKSREYERYGFPIYKLNSVQRNGREAFENEIREILSDGFDAVHLHTSSWRGFLIEEVAMDMGVSKVIVHSHSTGIDFESKEERDRIYADHIRYKEAFSMKYATDVCACSKLAADWLFSEAIPRDQIHIMPNAVDAGKFTYNPDVRFRIRNALGIEDRIVLGNVGRYSFTKNQDFLVDCFFEAHKKNSSLFLILIGQGENIDKVKRHVKDLEMDNDIFCYGWKDDIPDYLQAMDVFCLPSKFEGLPISVVEAQAAGMKCLVSDQVTKELNITGNVNYIPLNKEDWVAAILEQDNCYSRVDMTEVLDQAGYTIEASSRKLCSLYDGAL